MTNFQTLFDIRGLTAVITGGSGVLGSARARALAKAGVRVAILSLHAATSAKIVQAIQAENGEAIGIACDVLQRGDLEHACAEVLKTFGPLDILINAAGGNSPQATTSADVSFFNLDVRAIESVLDLNFTGTMNIECYQTSITSLLERISHLEQDILELRQCLQVQSSSFARSGAEPTSLSTPSGGSKAGATGSADWEITCLGRFHLRRAGREVPACKSRRGQSLLKYLLASPGFAASTDVLADCFWPRMDSIAGSRNLQVAVHKLRCSLRGCGPGGSDDTVLFRHNHYLLNPALSIFQDVDAFRAAYERGLYAVKGHRSAAALLAFEEARARYAGDYLADPYEEWASSSRMAMQDRRLHVLNQLGALYSEAGTWEAAIACYRELLTVDCYREDAYRLLMRCYATCGRPADVKQTYLTCRRYLHRDLHLAPAAETTRLYQQLMQQSTPSRCTLSKN